MSARNVVLAVALVVFGAGLLVSDFVLIGAVVNHGIVAGGNGLDAITYGGILLICIVLWVVQLVAYLGVDLLFNDGELTDEIVAGAVDFLSDLWWYVRSDLWRDVRRWRARRTTGRS